ncbi:MAG: XdhC family protein [Nitrospiraceae bacterium]|nr:XdhC family protein [Nitrospiraceae bacterium]
MAFETAQVAAEILALGDEENPMLARIVEMRGFGGRTSGEIAAVARSRTVGSLMFGSLQGALSDLASRLSSSGEPGVEEWVELGDREAVSAGLACGGSARVALLRVDPIGRKVLGEIARRRVVGVATLLGPTARIIGYLLPGGTLVEEPPGPDVPALSVVEQELGRMVRARRPESRIVEQSGILVHLEVFSPPSRLVVVGTSELSAAIVAQFALLGVEARVCDTLQDAEHQIQGFGSNDALVLLSHDHSIGVPLIGALAEVPGIYIGALGSRHTQQVRRELLEQAGVDSGVIDGIHGPVGLDLGSRTPAETAVAIAAEFLAHRSGRDPVFLMATSGAING